MLSWFGKDNEILILNKDSTKSMYVCVVLLNLKDGQLDMVVVVV